MHALAISSSDVVVSYDKKIKFASFGAFAVRFSDVYVYVHLIQIELKTKRHITFLLKYELMYTTSLQVNHPRRISPSLATQKLRNHIKKLSL